MNKKLQTLRRGQLKIFNPLEANPQLFREIIGKISGKNIFITSLLSMLVQIFVVALYFGKLPDIAQKRLQYSRYCTGLRDNHATKSLCLKNIKGWSINWELFWHDIFIFFTIASIVILLVISTFMIIADLVQEEKTGTLNFIRLSPQSASKILFGKIVGVPILVNFFVATIFPLHLISALKANIPWYLILSFDLIVIAGCAFVYSFSGLFALVRMEKSELKPWIATFVVACFFLITTCIFFDNYDINNSLAEWLLIFNPILALTYVLEPISVAGDLVDYIDLNSLSQLSFYGQHLWSNAITGMGFILFNYCLWTYWLWQGATRLFHNPTSTIFSKKQSYWITGWFVAISLGFTLQINGDYNKLAENFIILQCLLFAMLLGLVAALSPHRQKLYDWARYRHQLSKNGKSLVQELVFGEKSPSSVAIAINAAITIIIIAMGLLIFPSQKAGAEAIGGFVLTMGMILLYSVIVQWMLLMKSHKRVLWTSITISLLILLPPILFAIADVTPQNVPLAWFFSSVPFVGIEYANVSALILGVLGQWLAITFVSFQMMRKLRQAGRSETQKILAST
ncbi:hypothetical protein Xen7305DRAFT_00005640 [Xenococcus sp. PCC 7305]|uniref:hypothetical protein n=1 Tax=Xenococcus sp. PCC 7305 TaxID=102125 RepID=UPI0002AC3CC6|nr:hypothetical protein [Xenococcus sp. PCC 7305]ELS00863.1 hypothetical protein Xen7305DRAFT_00005640 [Xenococcus sp. PCC 7305]